MRKWLDKHVNKVGKENNKLLQNFPFISLFFGWDLVEGLLNCCYQFSTEGGKIELAWISAIAECMLLLT